MKLNTQQVPQRPQSFLASELLHGDNEGFIINAYLAMQRQWPDEGGFAHYKYLLDTQPGLRARVLRELASSETARHLGSQLVDDLAPDFLYVPDKVDPVSSRALYEATSQRLGLLQVIHDMRDTRALLSHITLDGVSEAVETIVSTAMSSLGLLDSRLSEVETSVQALRNRALSSAPASAGSPPEAGTAGELAWLRHEVINLSRRLAALEAAADADRSSESLDGAAPASP